MHTKIEELIGCYNTNVPAAMQELYLAQKDVDRAAKIFWLNHMVDAAEIRMERAEELLHFALYLEMERNAA